MKAILAIIRLRVSWLTEQIENALEYTLSTIDNQQSNFAASADIR